MKNMGKKYTDLLFQKTKEIPTEVPLEKLEQMILNFPIAPIPTVESHWFVKLFNLKYIAMTILPLMAVLAFLLVPEQVETTASFSGTETKKIPETPISFFEVSPINETETLPPSVPGSPPAADKDTRPKRLFQKEITPDLPVSQSALLDIAPIQSQPVDSSKLNITNKKQEGEHHIYPVFNRLYPYSDSSPVPFISSSRLKKLRRDLYKNFISDGILINKGVFVEMKLKPDSIIVNGHLIPVDFYSKYFALTSIVGVGPDRKIKMSRKFILAGDFGRFGFEGHGVGTFKEALLERDPELSILLSKGEEIHFDESTIKEITPTRTIFEKENDALISFANKIQYKTPDDSGRKRLFTPKLNEKKLTTLHQELTILLTEDNFINEENEFAIIQLPKNTIRVNGQILTGEQFEKYQQLIRSYRIKHGRDRMILRSTHYLKVGNYNYGNFTGTIITLPFEE